MTAGCLAYAYEPLSRKTGEAELWLKSAQYLFYICIALSIWTTAAWRIDHMVIMAVASLATSSLVFTLKDGYSGYK